MLYRAVPAPSHYSRAQPESQSSIRHHLLFELTRSPRLPEIRQAELLAQPYGLAPCFRSEPAKATKS